MNNSISIPALSGLGLAGVVIVGLAFTAFWIWMLVDCAMNETSTGSKIAWILIMLFAGCLGTPVYFFVRYLRRR